MLRACAGRISARACVCVGPPRSLGLPVRGAEAAGQGFLWPEIKSYDHKLQQHVALKIVRNEKRFHHQAQEEVRILEHPPPAGTRARSRSDRI